MNKIDIPVLPDREVNEIVLDLIDQLDALVAYWDIHRVCVFANCAYRDSFGAARATVVGMTMAELLGPLYERNRPYIEAAYAGHKQSFEREIPRADGSPSGCGMATYLPHIVDGRVLGIFVLVSDITDMKALQTRLRESEVRFRETFDSAPIGMGTTTVDGGTVLEANAAFCNFIGYTLDELKTKSVADLTHPDDLHLSVVGIERLLAGAAHSYSVEKRYCRKDGSTVWGQVTASVVRADDGAPRYLIFQIQNIDERRSAAAQLQDARDRLALALDASQLSIWEYDIVGGNVRFDAHWAAMVGMDPGEVVMSDAALALNTHPEDIAAVLQAVFHAFKGAAARAAIEFRYRAADGAWKWIRCTGKVIERNAAGRAVRAIGTNQDITERKSAEERVRQLAFYDPLTGLPNRQLLNDRMQQSIAVARRDRLRVAVLFIDLDKFKPINDQHGHEVGDSLLCAVAQRMRSTVRDSDTVARIGGDEFIVVLPNIAVASDAMEIAEKLRRSILEPFAAAGTESFAISCSIGVVLYPMHADNPRDLLRLSDQAMYQAKSAGKNAVRLYAAAAGTSAASQAPR